MQASRRADIHYPTQQRLLQIRYAIVIGDKHKKYFFPISGRRDPDLKSRWGTICPPTEMRAFDGKVYQTQAGETSVQELPSEDNPKD